MINTRAVLFDMAGTVVSRSIFKDHGSVVAREFSRIIGLDELQDERALREGSSKSVEEISRQQFYLYRDLFAAIYTATAISLGTQLEKTDALRLSNMWWKGCAARFSELGLKGGGLRIGAIDTLRKLRERGIHIGLVSNFDEDDLQNFLAVDGFGNYFDTHISSEAARSCKPDAEIFDIALRQADCKAEEVIFVGDTPTQDIDGAAAAGMQTVLIHDELKAATEELKPIYRPDHEISELPELLNLLA